MLLPVWTSATKILESVPLACSCVYAIHFPSPDHTGSTFILSFGVPLGLVVYAFFQDEESAAAPMSLLIPLIGLGCLYFPMSLLAVAMKDTRWLPIR